MPFWVQAGVTIPVLVDITCVEDFGTELEIWGVQLLGIEGTGMAYEMQMLLPTIESRLSQF